MVLRFRASCDALLITATAATVTHMPQEKKDPMLVYTTSNLESDFPTPPDIFSYLPSPQIEKIQIGISEFVPGVNTSSSIRYRALYIQVVFENYEVMRNEKSVS